MTERVAYSVEAGPSLFMSGEQDWHIRVVGESGVKASFRAHAGEAERIAALLNRADPAVDTPEEDR